MAKIIALAEGYSGVSASVQFENGVGYTDNPHLIDWFRSKGYLVVEEPAKESAPEPALEPEPEPKPKPRNTKKGVKTDA